MRSLLFALMLVFVYPFAGASMSSTATIYGKVMVVDQDKIVINSNNKRVAIPAKYVKDKFTVGETAYIDIPQSELKNLKIEALPLKKKSSHATEKKNMTDRKWFDQLGCEKMQITQHKTAAQKEIEKVTINDIEYIKSFQTEINQLPTEGDIMISMGPAAHYLTLEFSCAGKNEVIEFYNSRIKTPATSFYSKTNTSEQNIWQEIQQHFKPASLGQAVPKLKNVIRKFDTFSIEYLGSEDRTPKGTTASLHVEFFQVINNTDNTKQTIEVRSGQLPPRPEKFKVGSDHFVLNTRTLKNATRIDPRMFVIDKD